jgi:hypothetical protein
MADASAVPNNLTPNISRREARVDLDALHALGYATDTEVCKLFGWTDRQLWENRRDPQRRIPYVPFGRLCLYKIADVQRHLEGLTCSLRRNASRRWATWRWRMSRKFIVQERQSDEPA